MLLDVEHDRVIKLNPIGAEIWELLNVGLTESQIVLQISNKYRVGTEQVAADVQVLLRRFAELNIATSNANRNRDQAEGGDPYPLPLFFPWYGQLDRPTSTAKAAHVFFALLGLTLFDLVLWLLRFKGLCSCVRAWPVRRRDASDLRSAGEVCNAVARACVWYPRTAMCLQRSAVTTCMLRVKGFPARMCIGARPMPFSAHAWVEVKGHVINDWPRVKTFYEPVAFY